MVRSVWSCDDLDLMQGYELGEEIASTCPRRVARTRRMRRAHDVDAGDPDRSRRVTHSAG